MADDSPYTGLDFGGKTGREWLAEFRADIGAVLQALDDWQDAARTIAYEAQDYNFSPGTRLEVPGWFDTLTSIIALWCDVELHIDPTSLCTFRRRMRDFEGHRRVLPSGKVGLHRVSMTDVEIESCIWTARETFDRFFHATLARATEEEQQRVMEQRSFTAAVPLTEEDVAILRALADSRPMLLTQEQIEGAIPKNAVALRTIQSRLPRLCKDEVGFVERPEGKRSGYWITQKGLSAIGRI